MVKLGKSCKPALCGAVVHTTLLISGAHFTTELVRQSYPRLLHRTHLFTRFGGSRLLCFSLHGDGDRLLVQLLLARRCAVFTDDFQLHGALPFGLDRSLDVAEVTLPQSHQAWSKGERKDVFILLQ